MDAHTIFDIDGQEVRCCEVDGHRVWQCACADFERRRIEYDEGFCAHIAVAIMRAFERGEIGP